MADVVIAAGDSGSWAATPRSGPIMLNKSVGYWIYLDAGALVYVKTTDGGATWGSSVQIGGAPTGRIWGYSFWPEFWTKGLESSPIIHIAWGQENFDAVKYNDLNTLTDGLATEVNVATTSFTARPSISWIHHCLDISVSRPKAGVPQIMIQWHHQPDNSTTRGGHVSVDNGATWTSKTALAEADQDEGGSDPSDRYLIFPGNEADEYDMVAIYWDDDIAAGGNDFSWKTWDDSGGTWTEQVTIDTDEQVNTGSIGMFNISGMTRHSDGSVLVCWMRARNGTDYTIRCVEWTGIAGGAVSRTDIFTEETGSHSGCTLSVDQITGDVYINWNGSAGEGASSKNHYYAKSSDGMVSWDSRVQVNEDAAAQRDEAWGFGSSNPLAGGRGIFSWTVTSVPGKTNFVNSFILAGTQPTDLMRLEVDGYIPFFGGSTIDLVLELRAQQVKEVIDTKALALNLVEFQNESLALNYAHILLEVTGVIYGNHADHPLFSGVAHAPDFQDLEEAALLFNKDAPKVKARLVHTLIFEDRKYEGVVERLVLMERPGEEAVDFKLWFRAAWNVSVPVLREWN